MKNSDLKVLEYLLRWGISLTFLGHGIVAILGNTNWLFYIEFFGVPIETAKIVLTFIGYLDVLVAFFIFFKPYKPVLIWAVIWTFSTALIRPITGEPIWAFVERSISWIAPIGLIFLMNNKFIKPSFFR